jgi:tetratricopeptide (TPR) repeat protein
MKGNCLQKNAVFLVVAIISICGCTKRAVPGTEKNRNTPSHDSAAFDYVFIEALKQKILGNDADALKYLEQCIMIDPGSDAAYYQISLISLSRGDLANGKKFAMKAVSINEKNIWSLTLLANIFNQEKNQDSSLIYYEKALKYFPENENLRLTIGNLYSDKGDFKKAREYYYYFEDKYGVNESSTIYLVQNLMNSGNLGEAEKKTEGLLKLKPDEILYNGILAEIYQKQGDTEKAVGVYKRLIDKDSDNPQTLMALSDFLISSGKYDEIIDLLNNIILNDDITKEDKINLFVKILGNDSIVNSREKGLEMALLVLEANYKDDQTIPLLRPEFYQKIKENDKAIDRLEDLIAERPDYYFAWEKLLLLYSEKGDFENLFSKGKECSTRFNRSFIAKVLYASAAIEKGEFAIAEEELRKSKILAGDQKEMLVQVITMEGDMFYRKKEYSKSFDSFKEALKIDKEDVVVLNNYAYYLAEQGKELAEAEEMSKKVIEKEKENGTYLDTYAWILYKRGKTKDAIKVMDQIISNGSKEDAEWCEHYGYMMKAIKKYDIAIKYWKKAIDLDSRKTYLQKEIENCSK